MTAQKQKTKHYRPLRLRRPATASMKLRMVPMIDVVFLLLVFFLLAANFRTQEGFLPAELPKQTETGQYVPLEPLIIRIQTVQDDRCKIQIGNNECQIASPETAEAGFEILSQQLKEVLKHQGRRLDDAIKLVPSKNTKWDHFVKAYNAIWQIDCRNVIFGIVE